MAARKLWLFALWVAAIVAIPLAGSLYRGHLRNKCSWDADTIQPPYRVVVHDHENAAHQFCCLGCAANWVKTHPDAVHGIEIADELSEELNSAKQVTFVQSAVRIPTRQGGFLHAFRNRSDAQAHAAAHRGRVLGPGENPIEWPDETSKQLSEHDPAGTSPGT